MPLGTWNNHRPGNTPAGLHMGLSWLGGVLVAIVLIFLFSTEHSAFPRSQVSSGLSIQQAGYHVASQTQPALVPAQGAETCYSEGEDEGRGDMDRSCCPSATCSGPGMTPTAAVLSRLPVTGSYRDPPPRPQNPFDQTPLEEPPRNA